MSACLPIISTRFPVVYHGLHVKDRQRLSSKILNINQCIRASIFPQIYDEPQQQNYYSPMGFRTPEYLGFLKLQVVLLNPHNRGILTFLLHKCRDQLY
jgi:hypothetical protein